MVASSARGTAAPFCGIANKMCKLGDYELNRIYTGDARELAKGIPDNSVDLIFTDPVYENIDDYKWLSSVAYRVLKPDSACLVWCATSRLADVLRVMVPPLGYAWQMIWQKVGPVYPGKPGMCKYAICLWLEKGQSRTVRKIWDFYQSGRGNKLPVADNGHRWRKSADNLAFWLSAFTDEHALVVDFFCGGGSLPAVCKMLRRDYLCFEISPEVSEEARERVRLTQPPLPTRNAAELTLQATSAESAQIEMGFGNDGGAE